MAKSVDKGRRGELEACKLLAGWWGGVFKRRGLGHKDSDIITPDDFPWSIECKCNYRGFRFLHVWRDSKQFQKWWGQCVNDAERKRKEPMLLIKTEGEWFMVVDYFRFPPQAPPTASVIKKLELGDKIVFRLEDLN